MKQHIVELRTFGEGVAVPLNALLAKNVGWKLSGIYNIEVQRIGGSERRVLAVFEARDESVGDFLD